MEGLPLSLRLLVIDDDDVDRERVLRLLARTSMAVDAKQADSSASALHLLRAHDFDCIMLDNQLGDVNGADLLPAIQRESRRPCPVIMITGAGNESLAVRALQRGAADYLTKYQLNTELLVRAIRRAIEHQRMKDELDELHQRMEQRVEQQAADIVQSERDLRAILDHTPSAIGYWSADLRSRFGNRAHCRWLGVEPEDLPGRRLVDVIGAERLALEQRHIDGVLRGESQSFEQTDAGPGGIGCRHAQRSFHADTDDAGRVRGFYATLNDVTGIKQAQARAEELAAFAQALFEHSPVGLAVFDEQLTCLQCNRALAALTGTTEQGLTGLPLALLSSAALLPLASAASATLADGLPRHLDVDLLTRFGSRLQASCAWARVEREGRSQLLLAVQDTTEQQQAHEALVAARNAAEQATRAKSRFLANMSHEIRTPMNAVIGLTRLALEDGLPEPARDYVGKAHTAAMALMGVLDDVLDHSKIEAGQLHLESVPLELEQVLQRVVDLFEPRIEQKGLLLVVEIMPGVPRWVRGDPLRLGQVLNNLVGNAVKFTEQGQLTITVQPGPDPQAGLLRFAVRDSGIGIAPEQQAALFEAFAQADDSITRRFGGTGLGLSICGRLVAQMRGAIGVTSAAGAGSEFWFTAALEPAPGLQAADAEAAGRPPARVLIVESGTPATGALLRSLRARRFEAQAVADLDAAAAALDAAAAAAQPFEALLLDWDRYGAQAAGALLQRLRQPARAGPVPAVLGMVSSMRRGPAAGLAAASAPDAWLTRPVLPSAVQAALLRADLAGQAPQAPAAQLPAGAEMQPLAGLRVMLVEDNVINQMVARITLERLGAEVTQADDGQHALALLEGLAPDAFSVVLMDIHMPRMDGLEATRRIRADPRWRELPVVGMTAAALAEDQALCVQAGMVGFITKPVLVQELLRTLQRWARPPHAPAAAGEELDSLPGFDLTLLAPLLRGNRQALPRLMRRFAQQEGRTVAEVQDLLARGETAAARELLHRLRGGAGTLGAAAIARCARQAEEALRSQQPAAAALAALEQAMQAALATLRERFGA